MKANLIVKREVFPASPFIKAYDTQKIIDTYNEIGIFFQKFLPSSPRDETLNQDNDIQM